MTTDTTTTPTDTETPRSPEITAMEGALTRGDFAEAQTIARGLLAHDDPTLRRAGEAMLDRFRPDRAVLLVFAITAVLMLVLAIVYLGPRSYVHR